jgi:hypothetical protein
VNVCLDYKRRKRRTSAEEFNEAVENQVEPSQVSQKPPSPDQQVLAGQLSRKVSAALEALPPKQRTAFILKNNQGLSIKEIAEMMQTAEGTVKVHLHRAVTALRQNLAGLPGRSLCNMTRSAAGLTLGRGSGALLLRRTGGSERAQEGHVQRCEPCALLKELESILR